MTWGGVTRSDFHPFHDPQIIVVIRKDTEAPVDALYPHWLETLFIVWQHTRARYGIARGELELNRPRGWRP